MKRSTINRSGNRSSVVVETLESRQMFCYAPLGPATHMLADPEKAQQAVNTDNGSDNNSGPERAQQTAGKRREIFGDEVS